MGPVRFQGGGIISGMWQTVAQHMAERCQAAANENRLLLHAISPALPQEGPPNLIPQQEAVYVDGADDLRLASQLQAGRPLYNQIRDYLHSAPREPMPADTRGQKSFSAGPASRAHGTHIRAGRVRPDGNRRNTHD